MNRFCGSALFLGVVFLLAVAGCRAQDRAPRVCLGKICYQVDVVKTPKDRERGLMFRPGLEPGHGMFFVFDAEGMYPFWMKNMSFPIDILWLDGARSVVHIAQNVPPCAEDPCAVYHPGRLARYVLEIPAGDAERYHFSPKMRASF